MNRIVKSSGEVNLEDCKISSMRTMKALSINEMEEQ